LEDKCKHFIKNYYTFIFKRVLLTSILLQFKGFNFEFLTLSRSVLYYFKKR